MVERQLHFGTYVSKMHQIHAITTAPIQKSVMIQAGICLDNGDIFSGHTNILCTNQTVKSRDDAC